MSNVTHETFRQLRAMHLPVEQWDFVFVFNLRERLDKETRKQWELLKKSGEWPKLKDMLAFIEKQAEALSSMETGSITVADNNQVNNDAGASQTAHNDNESAGAHGLSPSEGAIEKKLPPLENCVDDHEMNNSDNE